MTKDDAEGSLAPWWRSDVIRGAVLVAAIFCAYASVRHAGFVWDDDSHLTANPRIIGPQGLKEVWTTASANYFPLVLTSLWCEHALWGLNPGPYHLVNLALHALSAILLVPILRRLAIPGAWFCAALWALHPVQVESVAWISEMKNTQSAVFYLLAIWFYLRWRDATSPWSRIREYAWLMLCAACALLSKPSTVMLPVALLLCSWWRDKTWTWRSVWSVSPLFGLSALTAGWAIWEQRFHSFAIGSDWDFPFAVRAAIAGKAVWFYLGKLAWPYPLVFVYPRWQPAAALIDLVPAGAAVAAVSTLWLFRHRARGAFFGGAYFIALLFPVLGFFNVYYFRYSFVADHFQYLASMGPLVFVGATATVAMQRLTARPARYMVATAGALLITIGTCTWSEAQKFSDTSALWRSTAERNPSCWLAFTMLGNIAGDAGHPDSALRLHERALLLDPESYEAHYNLGLEWVKQGEFEHGVAEYRRALELKPDFPDAEHNLGLALVMANRPADALPHYEQALSLDPFRAKTEFALALALTQMGRSNDAAEHLRRAVAIRPNFPEADYAYAQLLLSSGQVGAAIAHDEAALRTKPDFFEAQAHLGIALYCSGKVREAVVALEHALRLQPGNAGVRYSYAKILYSAGATAAAIREYTTVVSEDRGNARAHYDLAVALRASGRNDDAATEFRQATQLDPHTPALSGGATAASHQ